MPNKHTWPLNLVRGGNDVFLKYGTHLRRVFDTLLLLFYASLHAYFTALVHYRIVLYKILHRKQ